MDARRIAQVDLNLLFTLHEVASRGSVTAAARALGRTQPAISTRLRQLEKQLGVVLFERAGRTMRPSPVGRAVIEEVAVLVAQLGTVLDRTRGLASEPAGTVRVGALPTLCAYMLAPVAVRMAASFPRVRLSMAPGLTSAQLDLLRGGELDVIASVGLVRDAALRVRVVGQIDACLVVPAKLRLPDRRLSLSDIARFEHLAYGKIGDPFFDAVWAYLEESDLARRVRIEVSNIQALKQLVLEGGGVAIIPRYTIVESTLAARDLRGLDVRLPLCVVTRPRGEDAPIVRELLRELAREVDGRRARRRRASRRRGTGSLSLA